MAVSYGQTDFVTLLRWNSQFILDTSLLLFLVLNLMHAETELSAPYFV